jgi:hypothetical protein
MDGEARADLEPMPLIPATEPINIPVQLPYQVIHPLGQAYLDHPFE